MTKMIILLTFALVFLIELPFICAAHYIVGAVNNAIDGATANGRSVVLWNPTNGTNNNLTDTIGSTGNSGTSNIYMIDCELLNNSCKIGDVLNLKVVNNGDNHFSETISITVTGAGYDLAQNITLTSIFNITSIIVDDDIVSPLYQIDLLSGSNRTVNCSAIIYDFDGTGIKNATAKFFDNASATYTSGDLGNNHYSNESCYVNSSYGANLSQVSCSFDVKYYANSSSWNCTMMIYDNNSVGKNASNYTNINSLLSIDVTNPINYGAVGSHHVSNETLVNVTNYGNVKINLSLYGYAIDPSYGIAMNCSNQKNISVDYEKYNLTGTNPGTLNLNQFESKYTNLTNSASIRNYNLNFRHSDSINDAINTTYWRIYLPAGMTGECSGNIVFGASIATGS